MHLVDRLFYIFCVCVFVEDIRADRFHFLHTFLSLCMNTTSTVRMCSKHIHKNAEFTQFFLFIYSLRFSRGCSISLVPLPDLIRSLSSHFHSERIRDPINQHYSTDLQIKTAEKKNHRNLFMISKWIECDHWTHLMALLPVAFFHNFYHFYASTHKIGDIRPGIRFQHAHALQNIH